MPFAIPSLADLRAQVLGDFAARLAGADAALRRSTIRVSANAMAGGLFGGFRALAWLSRQLFLATAESPYLDTRCADYGLYRAAATYAAGSAVISGTPGSVIPAGTVLQSADLSQRYLTQEIATIAGGGSVTVRVASAGGGSAGNQDAGAALTLVTAIAGVLPAAVVASGGLAGGVDRESDASLRARGLARLRNPPQGGAGTDFWQWARDSGIPTRAWAFPRNRGVGTCDVAFTIDTRVDPIPLTADKTAVLAYIAPRAPVIGDYDVADLTADSLAITITGMNPNDAATQAAVTAALTALAATVPPGGASYGDGVTQALTSGALFPLQTPGTLYLSQIEAAISSVGGIVSFDLTLPAADVTFADGHLPAAPVVTFA